MTMPGEQEEVIRKREAYAIWQEEGRPDGKDLDRWMRAIPRTKYLGTLGFYDENEATAKRLAAALKRAYGLRNFEIEHYWKRATYFWAFQVAIFAAFGLLWKETIAWSLITVALAGLGILTAVANALSARGSRFWQENWENHIDMLENEIEGRLYKTVWLRDEKVSFSVPRINQYLSYYFIVFWVIVWLYVAWKYAGWPPPDFFSSLLWHWHREYVLAVIAIMIMVGTLGLLGLTTDLSRGTLPKPDGAHGEPVRQGGPKLRWPKLRWRKHVFGAEPLTFIGRKAPDE